MSKGDKTTIITNSGNTVTGVESDRNDHGPKSWGDVAVRVTLAAASGGLSEILQPDDKVTVQDNKGNFWTGTEKKK